MRGRRMFRLAAVLLAVLTVCSTAVTAFAIDGPEAEITEEKTMEILDTYDPDSAYILRFSTENGNDYAYFWEEGDSVAENIETTVHEACHWYEACYGTSDYCYFVGDERGIEVECTDTFPVTDMAELIPEDLRTSRYSTYVGSPSENHVTRLYGIYGLMDEFDAYCTGMANTVHLYEYYTDTAEQEDGEWTEFVQSGMNNLQAYYEFEYYILFYLEYAKTQEPEIYQGIMENTEFREAFTAVHERFTELVGIFVEDLEIMADTMPDESLLSAEQYCNEMWEVYLEDYQPLKQTLQEDSFTSALLEFSDVPIAMPEAPGSDSAAKQTAETADDADDPDDAEDSSLQALNPVQTLTAETEDDDTADQKDRIRFSENPWWLNGLIILLILAVIAGVVTVICYTAVNGRIRNARQDRARQRDRRVASMSSGHHKY